MALYRITVKNRMFTQGMEITPGMNVEISSVFPPLMQPVINTVNQLFMNKYGVDLKKMNCLNMAWLKADKIG